MGTKGLKYKRRARGVGAYMVGNSGLAYGDGCIHRGITYPHCEDCPFPDCIASNEAIYLKLKEDTASRLEGVKPDG